MNYEKKLNKIINYHWRSTSPPCLAITDFTLLAKSMALSSSALYMGGRYQTSQTMAQLDIIMYRYWIMEYLLLFQNASPKRGSYWNNLISQQFLIKRLIAIQFYNWSKLFYLNSNRVNHTSNFKTTFLKLHYWSIVYASSLWKDENWRVFWIRSVYFQPEILKLYLYSLFHGEYFIFH